MTPSKFSLLKEFNIKSIVVSFFVLLSCFSVLSQNVQFTTDPAPQNGTVTICEGNTVTFTDNSQNVPAGTSYNWSFPGGTPSSATGSGPHSVVYNTAGNYVAELSINGIEESDVISVIGSAPNLEIDSTNGFGWGISNFNNEQYFTVCSPSGFGELLDFSTSTYNTNSNTQHIIDWGDNSPPTSFTGLNISGDNHIYTETGTYVISYTVILENGCSYTQNYNVFIGASPSATVSTQGIPILCNSGSAVFNVFAGAQNANGTIYTFQINDGSPPQIFTHEQLIALGGVFNTQINSWVFAFTHIFNNVSCGINSDINGTLYPNAIQASVTVNNPCGQSSNANGPYIIQAGPQASFNASPSDTVICVNSTITFTDASIAGTNILGPSPNFNCNNTYKKYWTIQGPNGLVSIVTNPSGSAGTVQPNPFVSVLGNLGYNNNQLNNSLFWSNNATNEIAVTFNTPGTYTIALYTGSNNCGITSFSQTICVLPQIEANFLLSDTTGCVALPIDVTNNSTVPDCGINNLYQWSISSTNPENCPSYTTPGFIYNTGSSSSFEPSFSFTSPGLYEITLSISLDQQVFGCSDTSQTEIILVKDLPFASILPILECQDETITVAANNLIDCYADSAIVYNWVFPGAIDVNDNWSANPIVTFPEVGTYNYSLELSNECGTTTLNQIITIDSLVNVSINGNSGSCVNEPINLQGTITGSVNTGTWSASIPGGSFSSTTNLNTFYTPPLNYIGSITITLTSNTPAGPCLPDSASITLEFEQDAIVDAGNYPPVCINSTLNLNGFFGGAASQITWSSNGVGAFSDVNNPNAIYTPPLNFTGSIIIFIETDDPAGSCAPATDSVLITVVPLPVVVANNTQTICFGENALISASGAESYEWNQGIGSGSNQTVSPTTTTIYTVVGTDINGCQNADSLTIFITPLPLVNPLNNLVVCHNEQTQLISFLGSPLGTVFNWTNSNTTIGLTTSSGQGDINPFTGINTGTAPISSVIEVTPFANLCSGISESLTITVNPIPSITNADLNQQLCSNQQSNEVIWTNSLDPSLNVAYNWEIQSAGNNISGFTQDGSGDLPQMNLVNSGTTPQNVVYSITPLFDDCGGQPVTYTITVYPTPTIQSIQSQVVCSGDSFNTTNFESTISGVSVTYTWTLTNTNIPATVTGYPAPNGNGNVTGTTVNNTGSAPYSLVYSVTPNIAGFCSGSSELFELTVQPLPQTNFNIVSQTICTQTSSAAVNLTSPTAGVSFTWTATTPAGLNGVNPSSGTDNTVPVYTIVNTTNTPQTITIQGTATTQSGACVGLPSSANIVVLPTPVVNPIDNFTVCNGILNAAFNFTGVATGYNWSNNNTATGIANNTNNVLAFSGFTATNTGTSPISSTVTVTPLYELNGASCLGTNTSFVATVNPTAQVNPINAIEVCSGTAINPTPFNTNNTVGTTTYAWINSNTAIGLGASGNGDVPSFTGTNTSSVPITATITVTPTFTHNGVVCTGPVETFTVTVNPTPVLNPITSQIVCNNQATAAVNFISSGATNITWTNNLPSIGLAASGNGNIPPFISTNSTSLAVTANITASSFYNTPNVSCPGNTQSFTITVNPTPTVNAVSNQVLCHNESTNAVTFTGNVAGTTYNWTNSNTTIGLTNPSGANILPSFTGLNTTNNIVSTTITVTPTAQNCPGTPTSFNISVNPTPVITNTVLQQEICPGATSTVTWISNLVAGLTPNYTWFLSSNDPDVAGFIQNGTGNLPVMTLTNSGTTPQNVVYTVTPNFNGCIGTPVNYTIIVNPGPVMDPIAPQEICSGIAFNTPVFSSNVSGITYTWTLTNTNIPATVTGYPAPNGNGNVTGTTVNNTGSAPYSLVYSVTPNIAGFCSGSSELFELTVQPLPQTNFNIVSQTICTQTSSAAVNLTSPTAGVSFTWTATTPAGLNGVNPSSGTDNTVPVYTIVNTTNTPQTITIQGTATTQSGACVGLPSSANIVVLPTPVVNPIDNFTVCNGILNAAFNFTGVATGYNWSNNNTATGIANNTNNVLAFSGFTATNTGTSPISSTVTVTPLYELNGASCLGTNTSFVATVNPTAQVNPINAIEVCSGTAINPTPFNTNNTVGTTTYAWINSNTAIGLGASGNGDVPSFTGTNTSSVPITATITVTPTFTHNGVVCTGPVETFTVTVNPTPVLNPITSQIVCNNQATAAVNFISSGATNITWTNNLPSIGLAASGNGNIPPFISTNSTSLAVTANITASSFYNTPNVSCPGNTQSFTITVNPTPTVNAVSNQVLCHNESTNAVTFTGNVAGTTYNWTNSNTTIGLTNPSGANILPSFTGLNTTNNIVSTTITVTPTAQNCPGTPTSFNISVNPTPVITNTVLQQEICPGATSTVTWISNLVAGLTPNYTWFLSSNDPDVAGFIQNGTGNLPVMTLTNSGTTPQNVVYTVTPNFNGCIGTPVNYTIIVNPGPVMDPIAPQEICSGIAFNTPVFSSNVSSTIYQWTLTNFAIPPTLTGYPAPNGTGNINGSVLENVGPSLVTLIYEVLPTSFGCNGVPQIFNLTIQPDLQVFLNQTDQTICDGSTTNAVTLTSNSPNTVINWSVNSIPAGLSGVNQLVGTSNIPQYTLINSTNQPLTLTFSVQALNSIDATICPGDFYTYSITVNPSPIVNPVSNQVLCNGSSSTPIQFTGSGTTYQWQNNLPSIGLAASGNDLLPSFSPINTGTTPITATISATPFFTLNGITCSGAPTNFTITINPSGQVNQIQDVVACNGDDVQPINFSSINSGGVNTFSWVNNNNSTGLVSGGVTSGTPAFVAQNNSIQANISLVTVTPTFTNLGVSCPGSPMLFNITVNPTPLIISNNNTLICNNTAVSISPQTNVPSIFAYQGVPNPFVSGITTNLQNGTVIQDVLVNSSALPQIVNYNITPISFPQGCLGSPSQISVTVQPDIVMSSPTSYEICSGTLVNSVLNSNIPSTYTWFATSNPNITGASTFGNTGNVINDILINTSTTPQQVVYTVIPTSIDGGCIGAPLIVNVLVYPELQVTSISNQTICSNNQLNILLTANAAGTFSWFATPNGNVTGISTSVQNSNTINDQLINLSSSVQQVVYNVVITANNQGCTSQNFPIIITINPSPQINPTTLPTVCAGANVPTFIPNGTYTSFNWTNNTVANGLAAGGLNASSVPSFTAQNPNNFPLNSSLQLTPLFQTNGIECVGQSVQIPFSINPNGQVNTISSAEVCNGDAVNSVVYSTQNILGTTEYTWSNNNLNTGLLLSSGTGIQPSFTATNNTNQPINSLITVISNYTNNGVSCPSIPMSYTITVNPTPSINSIQDVSVCNGQLVQLPGFVSPSANAYSWTNSNPAIGLPPTGQNNIPVFTAINNGNTAIQSSINVTGLYASTTSSLVCSGSSTSFNINLEPTPFVNALANQVLCSGENTTPVNFTGNVAGALYTWESSNTSIGLTQSSGINSFPSFVASNNTSNDSQATITVSAQINGCTGPSQTFNITVRPLPQIINANNQEICSGAQTTPIIWESNLTNNSSVTFSWILSSAGANISGFLQNGIGGLPPMVLNNSSQVAQNVIYTVIPVYEGCVGAPFNYSISVNPEPQMNQIDPVQLCSGEFFAGTVFSSNMGGVNYFWELTDIQSIPSTIDGYPAPSGNGAINGAFISNAGNIAYTLNYVITPSIGFCLGQPQLLPVTVYPSPSIAFGQANQEICSGSNSTQVVINSPTPNVNFQWQVTNLPAGIIGVNPQNGVGVIPSFTLNNTVNQPQTISFNVSAEIVGVGCSSTGEYQITVLPIAEIIAENTSLCSGENLSISLMSTQNASFVWNAIPNPLIAGASINNQNTTIISDNLINLSGLPQIQQYVITAILQPQGCLGETIILDVLINPLPIAEFSLSSPCDSDTIFTTNLSNPTNLFVWSFGDGGTSFLFEPWNLYSQVGTYSVSLTVTDALTACENTSIQTVQILPKPNFTVDTTQACELGSFNFINLTPGDFTSVAWDFGDGSVSFETNIANHTYTTPGCFDVTLLITSSNGCLTSYTQEDMVCVIPNPIANFIVSEPIQLFDNNIYSFENLSQNAITYNWDFGDGATSNSINPTHSYSMPPGFYPVTLVAFNEFGCSDTATLSIQLVEEPLIYVPNTFTPNYDGTNDVFLPIIDSGIDIYTYRLLIFNRWGEVIFESLNKEVGWDGSYGGEIMQDGVYIWKITFNSPDNEEEYEFIGHVVLLR
jgi:gliding motility-associated-like protein